MKLPKDWSDMIDGRSSGDDAGGRVLDQMEFYGWMDKKK